jgi:hypothetical protein
VAAVAGVAACGDGPHTPSLAGFPLVAGARVVTKVHVCNPGASAFCAYEFVVIDRRYSSSRALVLAQRNRLRRDGWIGASPDTGVELANESPGHKLRVTYATAFEDLKGIDLSWIRRPWAIQIALDRAVFDLTPAMSVRVETGSQ